MKLFSKHGRMAATAFSILVMAGCQTMPYQPYAREVKRQPGNGGEIALKQEHRDEDRAVYKPTLGRDFEPPPPDAVR